MNFPLTSYARIDSLPDSQLAAPSNHILVLSLKSDHFQASITHSEADTGTTIMLSNSATISTCPNRIILLFFVVFSPLL